MPGPEKNKNQSVNLLLTPRQLLVRQSGASCPALEEEHRLVHIESRSLKGAQAATVNYQILGEAPLSNVRDVEGRLQSAYL